MDCGLLGAVKMAECGYLRRMTELMMPRNLGPSLNVIKFNHINNDGAESMFAYLNEILPEVPNIPIILTPIKNY